MRRLKRILDDLTGPHSLNPIALLVSIPTAILFSVVSVTETSSEVDVLALVYANLVGFAFCAIFYLVLDRTLYKNRATETVKAIAVVAAILGFGLVKGFFTGYSYWLIRPDLVEFPIDTISRMIQATFVSFFTLPLTASLTAAFFKFRAEREALILEQVRAELKSNKVLISTAGKAEIQKLRVALAPILAALRLAGERGDSNLRQALAERLRETIEGVVRPASQRIWSANISPVQEFDAPQILRLALRKHVFDPLLVPAVYIALFLPTRIILLGIGDALIVAAIVWALTAVIFWLAMLLKLNSLPSMVIRLLAAIALISVLTDIVAAQLIGTALLELNEYRVITGGLLMLQVCMVFGLIGAAREIRSEVIAGFAKLTQADPNEVKIVLGRRMLANRKLAQYLHSQVQNKLLSISLKLGSENPNEAMNFDSELDELEKMLVGADQPAIDPSAVTLDQVFAHAKKNWQGFVALEIKVSGIDTDSAPERLVDAISQAIDEAVGNAWRHGKATEVKIQMTKSGKTLKLTAKDNGIGPTGGQKGLGSALYTSLAGSNWSIEPRVGSGAVLTLVIPVAAVISGNSEAPKVTQRTK